MKNMHPTKNSLPEATRISIIQVLQRNLSCAVDLMLQAKQAHWNVKGPHFIGLHELFDKISEDFEDYVDTMAERIVQCGGIANGVVHVAAKESTVPHYPLHILHEKDHVEALSKALAYFGEQVRNAIDAADTLGDKNTADIFTEISRGVDKYIWFVEAHSGF